MKETFVVVGIAVFTSMGLAQSAVMETPRDSQAASISQRVELTDIVIHYSRPLAKGRKLWGDVVPYKEVWRAGANENTSIEFSDPVFIDGQRLDRGSYGLHMIPDESSWTVIFSRASQSWGSYSYDEKEDALRVKETPRQTADQADALTYSFDDLHNDSVQVTMRWGTLAVGFTVKSDPQATVARLRDELRGRAKFTWDGWNDAAQWCLDNKVNLDEALQWTDQSIENEKRFDNQMTKANILSALHRDDEAKALRAEVLETGRPEEVYSYGRGLQAEKKKGDAIAVYRVVVRRFPQNWIGELAAARVDVADGKWDDAVRSVEASLGSAPGRMQTQLESLKKRVQAKEDINN